MGEVIAMWTSLVRLFTGDSTERHDRGATAVEYAIMVSLIAAVIVLAVGALGLSVSGLFQSFLDAMKWA